MQIWNKVKQALGVADDHIDIETAMTAHRSAEDHSSVRAGEFTSKPKNATLSSRENMSTTNNSKGDELENGLPDRKRSSRGQLSEEPHHQRSKSKSSRVAVPNIDFKMKSKPVLPDAVSDHGLLKEAGQKDRKHKAVDQREVEKSILESEKHKLSRSAAVTAVSDSEPSREELKSKIKKLQSRYDRLEGQRDRTVKQLEVAEKDAEYFRDRWEYATQIGFELYAHNNHLQWDDRKEASLNHVLLPLFNDAIEAGALRGQVQDLQQQLLSNVQKVQAVTDEQFTRDFEALASAIKSLSRSAGMKLAENVELSRLEPVTQCTLLKQVNVRSCDSRGRKKCILEAFLWSVLIDHIFASPFEFLDASAVHELGALSSLFATMFGTGHMHGWPFPSELAERWRYTTMERLVQNVGMPIFTGGKGKGEDPDLESCIQSARVKTKESIRKVMSEVAPGQDYSKNITTIVDKAFVLAVEMSLQRSRIQVGYCWAGYEYKTGMREFESVRETDEIEAGLVTFVVAPALMKWGDSQGGRLDDHLWLASAKVFVQAYDKVEFKRHEGGQSNMDLLKEAFA